MEGGDLAMSSVDDRVVAMKFDNNTFERAAAVTLNTLQRLKNALLFHGASKGLEGISGAAKKVDLNPVAAGADNVGNKFSAMSVIAVTALATIATKAVQTGLQVTKSLTVGPLGDGFNDYNEKLTSVQTVMNSTGKSLQYVGKYFDQLDTYADKTIYNLTDMTSALAKFTNAGIDLPTAIPAIKGIANMTALAGQGANSASIAYYNLSQSLAAGFLSRMDFKSLELANVATRSFKDQLIKTALATGDLTKKGKNYETQSGKTFTAASLFTDGLQEQWAQAEVLTKTLGRYGDATKGIGKKAQSAAQDVRSLPMMIDTLKAAVGTSWTQSFEIILGDVKESKDLFTDLTFSIGKFLSAMGDARNKMLNDWDKAGGRLALLDGLRLMFKDIASLLRPIGAAWHDTFGSMAESGPALADLSKRFLAFWDSFKASEGTLANIHDTFAGVFAVMHIGMSVVKGLLGIVGKLFGAFFAGDGGVLNLTGSIGRMLVEIDKALTKGGDLAAIFETIGNVIAAPIKLIAQFSQAVANMFGSIDEGAVKNGVTSLLGGISEAIGQADFNGAGTLIGAALAGGILLTVRKFLKQIKGVFDDVGGIVDSIKEPFEALTGVLKAMQTQIQSKTLMNIAIAVGVLAASMYILAKVDGQDLAKSMAAMAVGFGQLVAVMLIMMKFASKGAFIKMPIMAASLVILAGAMVVLGVAMKIFATMSWEEIGKGLTAVGGSLAAIGLALKLLDPKALLRTSISLVAIGVALNTIAVAMKIFASMSWEDIGKGLVGVSGAIVVISQAMRLMDSKRILRTATGLILLGVALNAIAVAAKVFATMNWEQMGKGMVGIAGSIALIGLAMRLMDSKAILRNSAALILLGVGLNGIALAMKVMGTMGWENIAKGLVAIGGAIAILAIGLNAMGGGAILGAAALVVAAGALALMTPVLVTLGSMSWEGILKGMVALAAAMAVIGIAGALLTPVVPVLAALAGVLVLVGVAMLAAGAGMSLFANAFATFSKISGEGITNFKNAVNELATTIPTILTNIGKGLVAFAGVIAENGDAWAAALTTVLLALIDAVIKVTPRFGRMLVVMIKTGLAVIRALFPDIVQTGFALITAFLTGVENNIGKIVEKAAKIARNFMREIGNQAGPLADSAAKMIIKFVNAVADAIDNNAEELGAAGGRLASAIVRGMVKGLGAGIGEIKKAAANAAKSALDAAKGFLGIHSPSRKFGEVGKWSALGLARGIHKNQKIPMKAALKMAKDTIASIRRKITEYNKDHKKGITPKVTPVVDMKKAKADLMMLQERRKAVLKAETSRKRADKIAANQLAKAELMADVRQQPLEIRLEQNNYSPKALDPIETYRNTKNAMALTKEALAS